MSFTIMESTRGYDRDDEYAHVFQFIGSYVIQAGRWSWVRVLEKYRLQLL